jgi:hypothetical protein
MKRESSILCDLLKATIVVCLCLIMLSFSIKFIFSIFEYHEKDYLCDECYDTYEISHDKMLGQGDD